AALNRFVRNEPGVAPAADAVGGGAPARDVRRILIGDAERESIELGRARWREVKHELVAVVEKPIAVDRLVVAHREIAIEAGVLAGQFALDRNRLDPVNDVLQFQVRPYRL